VNEEIGLVLTDVQELIRRHQEKKQNAKFRSPRDFVDEIFPREGPREVVLPWQKTHEYFAFRPGETTIWAGDAGTGKSMLLGQVMGWLLRSQKAVIASMEMPPARTLERMIRQCCGSDRPSRDWVEQWVQWATGRLYLYDAADTVPADEVLAATAAAASVYGLDHVVIDSLMTVDIDSKENRMTGEVDFMRALVSTAREEGIHVHLVAHARKPEATTRAKPSKFDVAGSSNLVNLASNVLIVAANAKKAEAKRLERTTGAPMGPELAEQGDLYLDIAKQRNGPTGDLFALWHDGPSMQFTARPDARMPWPEPWR
jgi:twinkle protein